ncbi:carbonic anhydrase-related protein 10-like [Aplysia californica]|uniref:Carbonic anhydrase-related protein 10-like n=1 Tax=Aplysia californica TaxID=6500 RepID=A0ABM1VR17_APLCA|nr:carbonic anhydrase-related protein 10-like [Aplysia californica]
MEHSRRFFLAVILVIIAVARNTSGSLWANWWAYDEGISGPHYWGLLNRGWTLCNKGHNQSPVNIDPKTLLFDPSLTPLEISGSAVSGTLRNMGHSLTFDLSLTSHWSHGVNLTGGPLSYTYRTKTVHCIIFNLGPFTFQIQLFAFNSDLYHNLSAAMTSPRGVLCVAILVKVSNATHPHFERIHKVLNETMYKGDEKHISYLNLGGLLPETDHYMTYDGSLTHPACHETVTWLVYNKPIYLSHRQMAGLRRLKQDTVYNPVLLMAGNIRPTQPLNQRTVRTNINTVS